MLEFELFADAEPAEPALEFEDAPAEDYADEDLAEEAAAPVEACGDDDAAEDAADADGV